MVTKVTTKAQSTQVPDSNHRSEEKPWMKHFGKQRLRNEISA